MRSAPTRISQCHVLRLGALLSSLHLACATPNAVPRTYIAVAAFDGGSDEQMNKDGANLAPDLQKSGVLWRGSKIALVPGFRCGEDEAFADPCYAALDRLEEAIRDAGFWTVSWRMLLADPSKDPIAMAHDVGLEFLLYIDAYSLSLPNESELNLGKISFEVQEKGAEPKPLTLQQEEWEQVRPRCIQQFSSNVPNNWLPGRGSIKLRLLSLEEERVLWTRRVEQTEFVPEDSIRLYHEVNTTPRDQRQNRRVGAIAAAAGVALIGGSVLAVTGSRRRPWLGAALGYTGLGVSGIGAWLMWDARPSAPEPVSPAQVLCVPELIVDSNPVEEGGPGESAQFDVAEPLGPTAPPATDDELVSQRRAAIESKLRGAVVEDILGLVRPQWSEKKKKKHHDKKDPESETPRVPAMSCRWIDHELICRPACTLCKDPWKGPCEVCKPPPVDDPKPDNEMEKSDDHKHRSKAKKDKEKKDEAKPAPMKEDSPALMVEASPAPVEKTPQPAPVEGADAKEAAPTSVEEAPKPEASKPSEPEAEKAKEPAAEKAKETESSDSEVAAAPSAPAQSNDAPAEGGAESKADEGGAGDGEANAPTTPNDDKAKREPPPPVAPTDTEAKK